MVKLSENARNAIDRTKLYYLCRACLASSEAPQQPISSVKSSALASYFKLVQGLNEKNFDFNIQLKKLMRCDDITKEESELLTAYANGEDKVCKKGIYV